MKTKISLLLLAILCNFSVFAQSDFDKYFEKKSLDRKSTRLNSSHIEESRMPSSA